MSFLNSFFCLATPWKITFSNGWCEIRCLICETFHFLCHSRLYLIIVRWVLIAHWTRYKIVIYFIFIAHTNTNEWRFTLMFFEAELIESSILNSLWNWSFISWRTPILTYITLIFLKVLEKLIHLRAIMKIKYWPINNNHKNLKLFFKNHFVFY
jgi:hypothetical protein